MLGPDMLVAPVYLAGQIQWEVYLPEGSWIHLWTGEEYEKGSHTVPAGLGDTPVFYKKGFAVCSFICGHPQKTREVNDNDELHTVPFGLYF